jgi:hypothetical protein
MVAVALDKHIARLSKILVDSQGATFDEAQALLQALTLEVVIGQHSNSPAAHAAALTAVSVGSRTFVGGVRLAGAADQPLNSTLPLASGTLAAAAAEVGAGGFEGEPAQRVVIGDDPSIGPEAIRTWWSGWSAGVVRDETTCQDSDNPLVGIVAGALAVGAAFDAARGVAADHSAIVDLWPATSDTAPPDFGEVFLPGALWLIGLGNLGQAFLWALAALPFANPADLSVVLQDRDKVSEENWATSVLVRAETYGDLKTRVAEAWARAKGFDVRRIDRRLVGSDRLQDDDPRLALCGVDKIAVRKLIADVGFEAIVDAGLGRKASDFDRYRVTVFDAVHPIDRHFEGQADNTEGNLVPDQDAYRQLEAEVGACGAAQVAGASVAAPYVSAIAAAVAVTRLIAITSGCAIRFNEVRRLSAVLPKVGGCGTVQSRAVRHAGRPKIDQRLK